MRLGEYFVFDTSACRFYKIDELTYKFLKLCRSRSIMAAKKALLKGRKFFTKAINGVAKEIALLSENGLFDVPDYSISDEEIQKELDRSCSRPITGIELALAETCNLACKYCYCGTCRDMPNKGLMSEKVAHQAVDWLFKNSGNAKKVGITLFGGEPLLNKPVIYSLVEYSQRLGKQHGKTVTYSMTTNATLLDDEFLAFIKKHNIIVMVSLDGPRKIHDAQCPTHDGKGSYNLATAGAKRMLTHRPVSVRCTATHPVPNLKELSDFFKDFGFGRALIGPTISPAHNTTPYDFTDEDFKELSRQNEALIPEMLEKSAIYAPFERLIARIDKCSSKGGSVKCGACHNCIFVDATGALFPCHRFGGMKEWQIGHISREPDIERYKKFWKDYRRSLVSCESCWAWPVCKGPCPWETVRPDGTFDKTIRFCEFRRHGVESAAYIYAWRQEHAKDKTAKQPKETKAIDC